MSSAVFIKCGQQPRAFAFGSGVASSNTTTITQNSRPVYKESVYSAFQAIVVGTGVVTATVAIQASNDDNTGRGFVPPGNTAPGFLVTTTNASATLGSPGKLFTQELVGATISCPGVTTGTVVSSVAAGGAALTMSANATVTNAVGVQADLYANNWLSTAMGTITLSGASPQNDGFTTMAAWRYVRAAVSGVTGTNATVSIWMGV